MHRIILLINTVSHKGISFIRWFICFAIVTASRHNFYFPAFLFYDIVNFDDQQIKVKVSVLWIFKEDIL